MSKRSNLISKDVKYVNKDFGEFRQSLIDFSKNYFPDTYNDFNEASPGMMFIELASYVGDVLSFYTDIQLRESLLSTVQEKINLYNIANSLGFKPSLITGASADLDIYQIVPSTGNGPNNKPDFKYALSIDSNLVASSGENVTFRTIESVDFRYSSSLDPTEISVYSIDNSGEVENYLFRKKVKAVSGTILSRQFSFASPKPYDKITLPENNVLEILSVTDSDGNKWYEVPYLAQDTIPIPIQNLPYNDQNLSQYRDSAPYLLTYLQTERRFVTRLRLDDRTEIQFGGGVSSEVDEEIVPNPFNVGSGLNYFERVVDLSISPENFLYTKTYGSAPSSTTLTVQYTIGGGIPDNVSANSITTITSINVLTPLGALDSTLYNSSVGSLVINNPEPARGGISDKPIETLREEAINHFASQNRAVTKDDYMVRCYTLPPKFGAVAKAHIERDAQTRAYGTFDFIPNPLSLNLYLLGYDNNKNFTPLNMAVKMNLKNYLLQYRMLTDAINIRDAFIINLAISFEILTSATYNSNEVLLQCLSNLRDYFSNDKMQIGQPIYISEVMCLVKDVPGVKNILAFDIHNKYKEDEGYSGNYYDIATATRNNILYPALDPSIFEVKYKNRDILGRVVNLS
jgi:hypothetical protein